MAIYERHPIKPKTNQNTIPFKWGPQIVWNVLTILIGVKPYIFFTISAAFDFTLQEYSVGTLSLIVCV